MGAADRPAYELDRVSSVQVAAGAPSAATPSLGHESGNRCEERATQAARLRPELSHHTTATTALGMDAAPEAPARLSRASRDIIAGSVAGMVSKLFEHPFDLVKVRLQTQQGPGSGVPLQAAASENFPNQGRGQGPQYRGALDCFRQTIRSEGFRGLYRGLSMPVAGATVENATVFFTYNALQNAFSFLQQDNGEPSLPQLAISAAGAGSAASFVLTPVELIKCRMQVQMIAAASRPGPATKVPGPLEMIPAVLRSEGIKGLWLGQTGTFLREAGGVTAWFLTFEKVTRWMISRRNEGHAPLFSLSNLTGAGGPLTPLPADQKVTKTSLSNLELILAGATAGVSYNFILFPADSVKSTIQTEQELAKNRPSGAAAQPSTFLQTFKKIYRTKGVRGLYAGAGITCLRSAPSSAIILYVHPASRRTRALLWGSR